MDNTAYVALGKQVAQVRHLGVVANNIANANTNGYKSDTMVFEKYLSSDVRDSTTFATDRGTISNFAEGALKATHRPLDVAINGSGFFLVRTPLGTRYTRNGNFHRNETGVLVTSQGYPVLSADGQEIVFEDNDVQTPLITEDGAVFIEDTERGTIGVVEFENPRLMRKLGNGLFMSDQGSVQAENSRIIQGVLEDSNVNSVQEVTKLIDLQRQISQTSNMINDLYTQQRSFFRKMSGGN